MLMRTLPDAAHPRLFVVVAWLAIVCAPDDTPLAVHVLTADTVL